MASPSHVSIYPIFLANLASQAWAFHSKYNEVSLKASHISSQNLPFLPSANTMWAICAQMIAHLCSFSRVEHWQGDWRIPQLPQISLGSEPTNHLLDLHLWMRTRIFTLLYHHNPSPAMAVETGLSAPVTPSLSPLPTSLLNDLDTQPWLQNCTRMFLVETKLQSLLRLLSERPALNTVKSSRLSGFQHRSESKIKIAWSQLSHHWICIPFPIWGCFLRLKNGKNVKKKSTVAPQAQICGWYCFLIGVPLNPSRFTATLRQNAAWARKQQQHLCIPLLCPDPADPLASVASCPQDQVPRRREVPLLVILSQDCFMSYQCWF